MLRYFSTKKTAERRARLAVERKLISADFPGFHKQDGDIEWHSESWVGMWVDRSFRVASPCATMTAHRGITKDGQIIWLVQHPMRPRAFHAVGHDPVMAFRRATDAWARCDELRQRRDEIKALTRDLLLGRARLDITIEDAAASPLSAVEVRSFMARFRMAGTRRISGRLAAVLAMVEPQVGFVIWTAHARRQAQREARDVAVSDRMKLA